MPVSDENLELYGALKEKRRQLYRYAKALFAQRDSATQFFIDPERAEVRMEMILIDGMLTDLNHNNPIELPSAEEFAAMQADVRTLRNAIGAGQAWTGLMSAGGAVLASWPN